MKRLQILFLLVVIMAIYSGCYDNIAVVPQDIAPHFNLSADKTSGSAPLTVHFTGAFNGKIDTILMLVPDCIFYPGSGKTIIAYALPDTTQPAKVYYNESFTYNSGAYKAVMRLQSKYRTFYSDTLIITVN